MSNINLNLTIEEVNTILEALGNQPYIKVADLINTIQEQAQSQLNNAQPQKQVTEKLAKTAETADSNGK